MFLNLSYEIIPEVKSAIDIFGVIVFIMFIIYLFLRRKK